MTISSELYHVGIVVPDLEAAMAHYRELLGVTWGPVIEADALELRDGDGNDVVLPNRICYSTEAPYLELMEEIPGSLWVSNEHSNLHHIGFWSDALPSDSASLGASGCPMQLAGREGGIAPMFFAYHRDPFGVRFELVDASLRESMEQFMFRKAPEPPG